MRIINKNNYKEYCMKKTALGLLVLLPSISIFANALERDNLVQLEYMKLTEKKIELITDSSANLCKSSVLLLSSAMKFAAFGKNDVSSYHFRPEQLKAFNFAKSHKNHNERTDYLIDFYEDCMISEIKDLKDKSHI